VSELVYKSVVNLNTKFRRTNLRNVQWPMARSHIYI